jgi:hypothetical protein
MLSTTREGAFNAVGITSQGDVFLVNDTGPLNISATMAVWIDVLETVFQYIAPVDQLFDSGFTSNSSRSQMSFFLPSVTSNNLSSLRIFYNGAYLFETTYRLANVNSIPNTPAGDSWNIYLGYSPVGAFIENLIPITFLPTGEIDQSASAQSLVAANALLASSVNALRTEIGDPEFDIWKLLNWIIVSYYWIFLYDFGQTSPTYYNFTSDAINLAEPVFYSSTNNIFVNSTLFSIYSSYLTDLLSIVPGLARPEFLPLDSKNSLQLTATTFLRSYSCTQRQFQPFINAAVSVLVADYVFIAGGYSLVVTVARWWQKRRTIEGIP